MPLEVRIKTYICSDINCPFRLSADKNTDPYSPYYQEKWKGIAPGGCASCHLRGVNSGMVIDLSDESNVISVATNDEINEITVDEIGEDGQPVTVPTGEYEEKLVYVSGKPEYIQVEKTEIKKRELTSEEKVEYRQQRDDEYRRIDTIGFEETSLQGVDSNSTQTEDELTS